MKQRITYQSSTLPNGLKVLTAQSDVPVVDVEVWTRTGYRYEKPDELGYAHLLEHMLFTGTQRRPTPYDLNLEVDRRGGYFNASTSQQYVDYEMQMMDVDVELMCDLLSDMLFHSLLSSERLENEKHVVLHELKQKQENHGQYLARFTQKKVLPGHPMSNNILDTEQTTRDATPEKLRAYLENHYRPDQSAVVMAGNIDHAKAVELVAKYFGVWNAPAQPFVPGLVDAPRVADRVCYEHRDIQQTFFSLNYYTPPLKDLADSAHWMMLSTFLAVGFTSALYQELREKRGLIYTIGASRSATWDTGVYSISTSTQKPEESLRVIDDVVAHIPEMLTEEAFARVQGGIIGSFTRAITKPGSQSSEVGSDFITYDRMIAPEEWLGHLQSATRQQCIALATAYLRQDTSILTAVGPKELQR